MQTHVVNVWYSGKGPRLFYIEVDSVQIIPCRSKTALFVACAQGADNLRFENLWSVSAELQAGALLVSFQDANPPYGLELRATLWRGNRRNIIS